MAMRLDLAAYGTLTGVLLVLFLVSVLYAIFLEWSERRFGFVSAYAWLTVVISVGYTLIGLAVISLEVAILALLAFVATGIPIVVRSLCLDLAERKAWLDRLEKRGRREERGK